MSAVYAPMLDRSACLSSLKIFTLPPPGLLCGQCKDGMGVGLLTNYCREYVDKIPQAIWLLPIYCKQPISHDYS